MGDSESAGLLKGRSARDARETAYGATARAKATPASAFETVDWEFGAERDRLLREAMMKSRQMRHRSRSKWRRILAEMLNAGQGWFVFLVVGFFTGLLAGMIQVAREWAFDLKFGYCAEGGFWNSRKECCRISKDEDSCWQWRTWGETLRGLPGSGKRDNGYGLDYVLYMCWATLFGVWAAWLVRTFAPFASGSGIPEIKTILGGFVMKGYLGGRTLVIKSVALVLSIASGMSVGLEAAYVHVACCVANVSARMFSKYAHSEVKKRELLSGAAAAGISVAFGAPVGGVLFSLEMLRHSVVTIGSKLLAKPAPVSTDSPSGDSTGPPTGPAAPVMASLGRRGSLSLRTPLARRMSTHLLGDSPDGARGSEPGGGGQHTPGKLSSLVRRNLVSSGRRGSQTGLGGENSNSPAGGAVEVMASAMKSIRRRRLRSAEAVLDSTPALLSQVSRLQGSDVAQAANANASLGRGSPASPTGDRNESPLTARSAPWDDRNAESPDEKSFTSSLLGDREPEEYIGLECDALEKELKKMYDHYCYREKKESEAAIGHAGFRGLVSDCMRFETDKIELQRVDHVFMFACGWEEAVPQAFEQLREEATGTPKTPDIPLTMTYHQFRNRALPRLAKVLMPTPPPEFMGHRKDYNRVSIFIRFILLPNVQRARAEVLYQNFYIDDVLSQIKLYRGVLQSIFAHYSGLELSWGPGNGKHSITEREFLTMLDNFGIIGMRSHLESRNVLFSKTMGLHIMSCSKKGPEGEPGTDCMVFSEFIEALQRIAIILFPLTGMKYEDLESGPITLFTDSDRDAARLGPLRNLVPNKWNMHDDRLHRRNGSRSQSSMGVSKTTSFTSASVASEYLGSMGAFKLGRAESADPHLSASVSLSSRASGHTPLKGLLRASSGEAQFHRAAIDREAAYQRRALHHSFDNPDEGHHHVHYNPEYEYQPHDSQLHGDDHDDDHRRDHLPGPAVQKAPYSRLGAADSPLSRDSLGLSELSPSFPQRSKSPMSILRDASSLDSLGRDYHRGLPMLPSDIDFSAFSRKILQERRAVKRAGGSPYALVPDVEKHTLDPLRHSLSLPVASPAASLGADLASGSRSRSLLSPPPGAVDARQSGTQSQVRFSLSTPPRPSSPGQSLGARDKAKLSVEELMEEKLLQLSQGKLAKVDHRMVRKSKPGSRSSIVHKTADGPVLVRLPRETFTPWQRNFK